MNTMPKAGDKGAAYIGFVATAAVILLVLFSVVKWTNGRFAGERHGAPAAGAPAAGAPASH